MFAREYRLRNFRVTGVMISLGILAGIIYVSFSDGFSDPRPMINGIISGGLLGLYTALIELHLFTSYFRRKIRFIPMMMLRVFMYSVTIVLILFLVFSISRTFWFNISYSEVLNSEEFQTFIFEQDFFVVVLYSTALTIVLIFSYQITRKIGPRFLVNMITGKYYYPRKNRLIFLFVQIKNANEISRKLGLINYYNFVNDLIYDITPPIVAFKAHIYQYVDNEIVLYWYPEDGRSNAACVRAFFAFRDRIYENRERYLKRYDTYPSILAALHIGDVVQGEIGHGKTEIDFYGDVLNTTSRMVSKTSSDNSFVISGDLLPVIDLPEIYEAHPMGEMNLRGKSNNITLYQISEKEVSAYPS